MTLPTRIAPESTDTGHSDRPSTGHTEHPLTGHSQPNEWPTLETARLRRDPVTPPVTVPGHSDPVTGDRDRSPRLVDGHGHTDVTGHSDRPDAGHTAPVTTGVTGHPGRAAGVEVTDVDQLAALTASDRGLRREVVRAESRTRSRLAAEERRLALDEQRWDFEERRRAAAARRRQEAKDRRAAERKIAKEEKAGKREARRAMINAAWRWARDNTVRLLSGLSYAAAVSSAMYGQASAMHRYVDLSWAVGIALFVETVALVCAKTALEQRLKLERALIPRTLVWVFVGYAATLNLFGHSPDVLHPDVLAVALAGASVTGMVIWEIRSSAKYRQVLRELGQLPAPPERLGWRLWLTRPSATFAAWWLDAQRRSTPGARTLLEQVAADRAAAAADRRRSRQLRALAKRRQQRRRDTAKAKNATKDTKTVTEPRPVPAPKPAHRSAAAKPTGKRTNVRKTPAPPAAAVAPEPASSEPAATAPAEATSNVTDLLEHRPAVIAVADQVEKWMTAEATDKVPSGDLIKTDIVRCSKPYALAAQKIVKRRRAQRSA